ncbi:MAG: TetR/AcrR family transcriptional regulator [Sandaracinaceae bacterium]|nr:TetR/AcrR family transcriptional regulator [Sandaracinaceae bacterium]
MARPRSDISPRIVQAARERFLLDGVDGASLRNIARDAGTSIGMIYYYFPTKTDLFLAVVEESYVGLLRDMEAILPNEKIEDAVKLMYRRIAAMSDVEFAVIRMIVREALISSERLDRIFERFARGHLPLVFQTLIRGMQGGELSTEHGVMPPMLAMVSLGILPQIVRRLAHERIITFAGDGAPTAESLADSLSSILMTGIGRRSA